MTGKDFFGKLLTDQGDDTSPWDEREPSTSPEERSDEADASVNSAETPPRGDRESRSHPSGYTDEPVSDLTQNTSRSDATASPSPPVDRSGASNVPLADVPRTGDPPQMDGFETTFDPSALRGPAFGAPSGDGIGSHLPDVEPTKETEHPTPPVTDNGDEAAVDEPQDTTPDALQDATPDPIEPPTPDEIQPPTTVETQGATPVETQGATADPIADTPPAPRSGDLAGIRDRVVLKLMDKRLVTVEQVKKALHNREKESLKATLWRILAQDPTVDREQVYREAALTYAFAERDLEENAVDLEFVRQVADVFPEKKRNRLIELRIVPIGYEFEQQTQMLRVVFITHDPSLPAVRDLMQDLNLERYELQYASEEKVRDLLSRAFPKKNEYLERMTEDPLAYDLGTSYEDDKSELIDEEALEAEINRSSLINLFEAALVEAVHRGASDIHIYPNARRQIEIHFRVDGRLSLWHLEDKVHPESLLAVIKDNTMNVDRFERDMAQDGFIQRKVDDALIRFRVSILPIATASNNLHAESIVIRVLDDRKVITDLSKLGLLEGALERFDMAIRQPHGMVILTGPTGSGKSTTLVAALHQVVTPEVNVLTVEDPVEYIIPDVRQIKLNHKLGLEGAIRAILRHDPDVVMVGEMRDRATAELAVKLANTGHLTFSTLHTNDAPSAVSRLYKMGVEPFLIAYAINLVVAQRLLRNLCPDCKVVDNDPDPVLLKRLGFSEQEQTEHTIYAASGDPTCKTCKGMGYKGRRAISEAMYFSREIRHMIVEANQRIDEDALREVARKQGMLSLQDSAREVVKMGETSVDEMMRVTMTED